MKAGPGLPELPELAARDMVDAQLAGPLVEELSGEVARLRRELDQLESAAIDAEHETGLATGDPELVRSSMELVERLTDDLLASARAEFRRTIEEPALRIAATKLMDARAEAKAILRAARAGAVAEPDRGTLDLRDGTALVGPPPRSNRTDSSARGSDVSQPPAVTATVAVPEALVPDEDDVADEVVFEAFWRDEHEAVEARRNALSPLEVLVPMGAMLLLLVLILLVV